MSSNHLLMIVHRIPYPPDKGDKIRSHHEFHYLRRQGWHVHLCTFIDDPEDVPHVRTLNSQCETASFHRLRRIPQNIAMLRALVQGRPLTVGAFFMRSARRSIRRILRDYPIRAVLCFSSPMAEYVLQCPELRRGIHRASRTDRPTLLMDLIDVDSDKWRQYAAQSSGLRKWIYGLESRRLAEYEKRIAGTFDATFLVSEAEAEFLRNRTGERASVTSIPNGVDTDYFHPPERPDTGRHQEGCSLVFCGVMDYPPNVDAVTWFVRDVLPVLREKIGHVRFHIVGAKPAREVLNLKADPGVEVLGRVPDVRPHVWEAAISVAPIRIARGLQNKVLEAMAMAKPVVATEQAFEGIEAVPGQDLVVTPAEPKAFAQGIASLWDDTGSAAKMGLKAREAVLERYSWDGRLGRLQNLLGSP